MDIRIKLLEAKITAIVEWLDDNHPEVWQEGIWHSINEAENKVFEENKNENI